MVGEVTAQLLRKMGIVKIKTVQEMPLEIMDNILGRMGKRYGKRQTGLIIRR